jgi:hypothetical protein
VSTSSRLVWGQPEKHQRCLCTYEIDVCSAVTRERQSTTAEQEHPAITIKTAHRGIATWIAETAGAGATHAEALWSDRDRSVLHPSVHWHKEGVR